MTNQIVLRALQKDDCVKISMEFKAQGWNKPESQFSKYYQSQTEGKRDVILAEVHGAFAGYLTIKWKSDYLPFKDNEIPEIADFNVLKKFQRRGIGTKLMDEAEYRIMQVSRYAGIGFGVYQDYGAAQILYVKRNYIPDGNGLVKNSKPIHYGEEIVVDDSIIMYLTKKL